MMAAGDGFRRCLFAAAAAAVLSSAVGFWALGYLRGEYRAANAAMRESAALRAAAGAREAELARYKKLLSGGSAKTPSRPESANKFYAALLAAVAESGMEGARVSGASERDAEALFTISGRTDYDKLRRFLASLRGLRYSSRVSRLLLEGSAGGEVAYSVEISTRTAEGGGAER